MISEYHRQWRLEHPERLQEYRKRAKAKYGPEYFRKATKKWRLENPEEYRLQRQRRRSKMYKKFVKEDIHNWASRLCGICGKYIEGNYHFDHIVPLSRGGTHEAANLQLAHPYSNQSKFTKLQSELTGVIITS